MINSTFGFLLLGESLTSGNHWTKWSLIPIANSQQLANTINQMYLRKKTTLNLHDFLLVLGCNCCEGGAVAIF